MYLFVTTYGEEIDPIQEKKSIHICILAWPLLLYVQILVSLMYLRSILYACVIAIVNSPGHFVDVLHILHFMTLHSERGKHRWRERTAGCEDANSQAEMDITKLWMAVL